MRGLSQKPAGKAAPLTIGALTTASGLTRAAKALNASPEDMVRIYSYSKKFIEDEPSLASMEIGKSSGGSFYDIDNKRIALGTSDPDVFAHEVGHAQRLHDASGAYKTLLKGSKALTRMLGMAALPGAASLTYSPAVDDSNKKTILRGLAAASALAALPNLAEEVAATANALSNSTSKLKTLKNLAPGLASHSFHDLSGAGTFSLFSHLQKGRNND